MVLYVHFILFEGTGKNIPFNSILDYAILSDFQNQDCNYYSGWGWRDCYYLRGGRSSFSNQLKVYPPDPRPVPSVNPQIINDINDTRQFIYMKKD